MRNIIEKVKRFLFRKRLTVEDLYMSEEFEEGLRLGLRMKEKITLSPSTGWKPSRHPVDIGEKGWFYEEERGLKVITDGVGIHGYIGWNYLTDTISRRAGISLPSTPNE